MGLPVCRQEGGAEIVFTDVDGCVTLGEFAGCSVHDVLAFLKYAGTSPCLLLHNGWECVLGRCKLSYPACCTSQILQCSFLIGRCPCLGLLQFKTIVWFFWFQRGMTEALLFIICPFSVHADHLQTNAKF